MTLAPPMSLAQARTIVAGVSVFAKRVELKDASEPVTADTLWDALLSLENAAEFVAAATRLDWQFHPRGFDNTDPYQRYGDGIVPWLATRVDSEGTLHNVPWCVVPCLLACASRAAFDVAWSVRRIAGRTPWGGSGDRDLAAVWIEHHPEVGKRALAELANTAPRARAYRMVAEPRPPSATAEDVLALLDACALGLFSTRVRTWPRPGVGPIRFVAARAGEAWGIAAEYVEGNRPSGLMAARVACFGFGSEVRGATPYVAQSSRPVPAFHAATAEQRLGPPALALASLGLSDHAAVVGTAVLASCPGYPTQSPELAALALLVAT